MIQLKNLSFAYDQTLVIKDISLTFKDEGLYGILGPNGSGKTTLLKLMCGILSTKTGDIYIEGKNMDKISRNDLAKTIAYVPQQFLVTYDFSVEDIIKMGRQPYHGHFDTITTDEKKMVNEAIELTGLNDLRKQFITNLSGGEMQRVMIARALVQDTPIILLDEPISHLDIHYQKEIILLLKTIAKDKNKIIITVLHDMNVGLNFCDTVHLLGETKVISGKPGVVLTKENIEKIYKTSIHIVANEDRQLVYW